MHSQIAVIEVQRQVRLRQCSIKDHSAGRFPEPGFAARVLARHIADVPLHQSADFQIKEYVMSVRQADEEWLDARLSTLFKNVRQDDRFRISLVSGMAEYADRVR